MNLDKHEKKINIIQLANKFSKRNVDIVHNLFTK